ncbi:hypothetical protein [Macrococcoides caseolyticum]|uniref:hypothetical protein n=1 Tax=Macrococcoides caseolyticum TaxID=69966 RepID=UPI001E32F7CF|nr:hypothetical protein [Macrococcus caseolyticus]
MYVLAIVEGKAPTNVVNNTVNGAEAPNNLGTDTTAVGGKAPTTVENTTTVADVDVNKGLGSTINKSESLEGSPVDKVKVGNEVKESKKPLHYLIRVRLLLTQVSLQGY